MDRVAEHVFGVAVMIMAIMFCLKEIYMLRKLGVAYFYDGWNYLAVCNYWLHFIGLGFRVSTRVRVNVCLLVFGCPFMY